MKSIGFALLVIFGLSIKVATASQQWTYGNENTPGAESIDSFDFSPRCLGNHGEVLPVNNQNVLNLETSTANQYLTRAHVKGVIGQIYADRNGHNHFQAIIGSDSSQTVEIVYSQDFGPLPDLSPGMTVEACGDYITSTEDTSEYPASPDRAIIHWVHKSDSAKHPSGFVMINGSLFGQGASKGSDKELNASNPMFSKLIMVVLENTSYANAIQQPFFLN